MNSITQKIQHKNQKTAQFTNVKSHESDEQGEQAEQQQDDGQYQQSQADLQYSSSSSARASKTGKSIQANTLHQPAYYKQKQKYRFSDREKEKIRKIKKNQSSGKSFLTTFFIALVLITAIFGSLAAYYWIYPSSNQNQQNIDKQVFVLFVGYGSMENNRQSLLSFFQYNDYKIDKIIAIVKEIPNNQLSQFQSILWVVEDNQKLLLSKIDKLISQQKSDYFFFFDSRWVFTNKNFILQSIRIMQKFKQVGQVLLHKDLKLINTQIGFSFSPGLHRKSDFLNVSLGSFQNLSNKQISENQLSLEQKLSNVFLEKYLYALFSKQQYVKIINTNSKLQTELPSFLRSKPEIKSKTLQNRPNLNNQNQNLSQNPSTVQSSSLLPASSTPPNNSIPPSPIISIPFNPSPFSRTNQKFSISASGSFDPQNILIQNIGPHIQPQSPYSFNIEKTPEYSLMKQQWSYSFPYQIMNFKPSPQIQAKWKNYHMEMSQKIGNGIEVFPNDEFGPFLRNQMERVGAKPYHTQLNLAALLVMAYQDSTKQIDIEKLKIAEYMHLDKKYRISDYRDQLPFCIFSYNPPGATHSNYQNYFQSLERQNYTNFKIILIVDDDKTDGTADIYYSYLGKKELRIRNRIQIVRNSVQMGQLGSMYIRGTQFCQPQDIIIDIAVGDMLISHQTLNILNSIYQRNIETWYVYTHFIQHQSQSPRSSWSFSGASSPFMFNTSSYRSNINTWVTSHMKSFRYQLLKNAPVGYFIQYHYDNRQNRYFPIFYNTAANRFLVYAFLEMCGKDRIYFVNQGLYYYYQNQLRNRYLCELEHMFVDQMKSRLKTPLERLRQIDDPPTRISNYTCPQNVITAYIKYSNQYEQCLKNSIVQKSTPPPPQQLPFPLSSIPSSGPSSRSSSASSSLSSLGHPYLPSLSTKLKSFYTIQQSKSIMQYGCQHCQYVIDLREAGFDIDGFDGDSNVEQRTKGYVKTLDIQDRQYLGHVYDWVQSFNLGQHIPPYKTDIYIANLAKHAKTGVLLSWASPADGEGSLNKKNNQEIFIMFRRYGFEYDVESSQYFQRVPELKEKIMVLRRV